LLVFASKETGLEVNSIKQRSGLEIRMQEKVTKIDNSAFERVEKFEYLGTTITNQNSIQEDIKSRLMAGNACYNLVQNLLSSILLSKNIKIKIYRTIILPVVMYGCETWSLTSREISMLRLLKNRVMKSGEYFIMRSLRSCNPYQILFRCTNK
jgi:hypothetical protein